LARYSPDLFAAALADAESQIRHYSVVPFFRWQQVAVERWTLALQSIVDQIPPGTIHPEALQRLKNNLEGASRVLATLPEASLRAATAEQAAQVGNSPYSALIQTVVGIINSTAGMIMAVVQPLLDELGRGIVWGAGAATGRPAHCPAMPYMRVFDRGDCTVDIDAELARLTATPPGGGPGGGAPPPPAQTCPAGHTGTPPNCVPAARKSGGGGILIGAGALLLLSQLLKR
jgi:hypothetical protein